MVRLALWIVCCFGFAWLFRWRIRWAFAAVLGLWMLVPTVGSPLITGVDGGALSMHAASWLIFAVFIVRMLHDPVSLRQVLGRQFFLFMALGLVVLAAFLASRTSQEGGGMVLMVDQILAPVLFFLLLLSAAIKDPDLVTALRTMFLTLVAITCVIALVQWLSHSVLFYEEGFLTQYWFNPETDRWMGTLDQPLALSLAICVAAPLVAGLKHNSLQALLLLLMITGVLVTQSRVGLFVVGFSVVAVVLFAKRRVWVKIAFLAVLGVATWFIVQSPLVAGVAQRLEDDTGSAEARARALEYFVAHWSDYFIAGQGIGASYRVAVQGGLQTSFENPLVMYSIDFGIVFAVLYFSVMAYLVLKHAPRHHFRGLTLAGLLAVAVPQTYSSLATRSAAAIIIWTVFAMLVMAGDEVVRQQEALKPVPLEDGLSGEDKPSKAGSLR
jgi:O-Antigen ligase